MNTPDLVVIGGAQGAQWGGPVGWAAFIWVPRIDEVKKLVDSRAQGTQAEADIMPFAAAIQWWHDTYNPEFRVQDPKVLCITDAPEVIEAGALGSPKRDPKSDWRFIEWFEKRGYKIDWCWESRADHAVVITEAAHARDLLRQAPQALPEASTPGSPI